MLACVVLTAAVCLLTMVMVMWLRSAARAVPSWPTGAASVVPAWRRAERTTDRARNVASMVGRGGAGLLGVGLGEWRMARKVEAR